MKTKEPKKNVIVSMTRVYRNGQWVYTMIAEVKGKPATISFDDSMCVSSISNLFLNLYPQKS